MTLRQAQGERENKDLVIEIWYFEFVWDLELVIWNF